MNGLELLSIEEAARNLSVSPWTLRAHVKLGRIAIVRCGRRVLISRAEVERIAREGLPSLRPRLLSAD
jgi:excisionase family DNA binding protein